MRKNNFAALKQPPHLGLAQKTAWSGSPTLALALALTLSLPALAAGPNAPTISPAIGTAAILPGVSALEATPKASVTAAPPAVSITAGTPPAGAAMERSVQATARQMTMTPMLSGKAISSEIHNFDVVSQGLWRGAQPSHKAIGDLAKSGVKTIIDLRYAGSGCEEEAQVAQQCGIKYVNIPLGFKNPSLDDIARFLAIVATPANQPVFVHCRQGADRTGTVVGVFRILYDHWSFSEAYNEMRQHHFKPFLSRMKSLVARCELDPKLSKELIDMASKLEEPATATIISTKSGATSI